MTAPEPAPIRGRQAEARRNDQRILEAARDVYAADLRAPMSAVAARARVGQASLYRRYPSKQALLASVCERGMTQMRDAAATWLQARLDPWDALAGYLQWYLESGTTKLAGLLGSFSPDEELFALARQTNEAIQALVDEAASAGRLRPDVTGADMTLIVSQIATVEAPDAERAAELRNRYLHLALQALALTDAPALPAPPPDAAELERPWRLAQSESDP